MIERCRVALVVAAAAYLALLPTGALSFWRSLAFATGAILAATLIVAAWRQRAPAIPLPDRATPLALAAWTLWSIASIAWSVDPGFSAGEVRADVLWGVLSLGIFYVAAASAPQAFERLAATMLGAFAFWTALATGFALSPLGWDTRPFHRGDGAFATWLVIAAPFLLLLCWRPPLGVNNGWRAWVVAALLFALLVVTARLSENRIVWLALAAGTVVAALAVSSAAARVRTLAGAAAVMIVFGLLFAHAATDRASRIRPGDGSVSGAFADDPRLAIWKHAAERIRERPLVGHGYGLHILGREIGTDAGDAKIMHPHNVFASQWLQTGVVGLALFVAMVGFAGARFVRFARSGDAALARLGAMGLAIIVAFLVRNLTDDFFLRASSKLLFAAIAMLLGAGALRARELASSPSRG